MNNKELKQQANFIYSKSSQYIVWIFVIVGTITEFVATYSSYWLGILAVVLISPIELGVYRALLKAHDRDSRKITTKEYVLAGFKEYRSYAPYFIGKKLYIWLIEAVIMLAIVLIFARNSLSSIPLALKAIWSGNPSLLLGSESVITASVALAQGKVASGISVGVFLGVIIAMAVGFVLNFYYTLTLYFAVDYSDMDIGDCLRASRQLMTGHVWQYIKLALSYILWYILAGLIASFVTYEISEVYYMVLDYLPTFAGVGLSVLVNLLIAFVSCLVPIILYKVKWQLAVTEMYRYLEDHRG